jgi:vacuolar-type H+-ATPase subunit C/Vma6
LFEIEVALQRAFARRASKRAHRGGSHLVRYVEQLVDVMNAWSALLHFVERDPAIVDLTFVEGGHRLDRDLFETLMSLDTRREVEARLRWELRGSDLARLFRSETAELETELLRVQIHQQQKAMRTDPNGAAPILDFALELRAEVLNLTGVIWGVALRAPAALIQANMVVA